MEFKTVVFICFVILAVVLLILFPELRSIFKGFTKMFVKDMATTPEGAAAMALFSLMVPDSISALE
mgnify:CR=1 FL=1